MHRVTLHKLEAEKLVGRLQELVGSEQWEALVRVCLGQGQGLLSIKERQEERRKNCLSDNDLGGARYYQGQIDMLEDLLGGQYIRNVVVELKEGGK